MHARYVALRLENLSQDRNAKRAEIIANEDKKIPKGYQQSKPPKDKLEKGATLGERIICEK
jgi:hypothetical protein